MIAWRAIADQLMYLKESILCFNSAGIANVKFDISLPPVSYVCYVKNINTQNIFCQAQNLSLIRATEENRVTCAAKKSSLPIDILERK